MRLGTWVGAALIASAAAAPAGEVVLTTTGGELEITGKLVAFENGAYVVETAIGPISVRADRVQCAGPPCPERDLVPVLVNARLGEEVSLSTSEDRVQVSGRLLSFRDQVYRVETKLGSLDVAAPGTSCTGPGCPAEIEIPRAELSPGILRTLGLAGE